MKVPVKKWQLYIKENDSDKTNNLKGNNSDETIL